MTYTYALSPGDVVSDEAGNVVGGWRIDVYDSRVGGTRITDLQDLAGNPLPGYLTTDTEGRYSFRRVEETIPVLWADDGQSGERWALLATEIATSAVQASSSAQQAAADAAAAQQSASDAAASADAAADSLATAQSEIQPAIDDLNAYQLQTPTLEELLFNTKITAVNYQGTLYPSHTNTFNVVIMVAPFALQVLSVGLAWDYYDLAASDTDYWEVGLNQVVNDGDGTTTPVAVRSTQITGAQANGGISQRVPWTFSGVDTTVATFQQGDLVAVSFNPVGAPPAIEFGIAVTIRYAAV